MKLFVNLERISQQFSRLKDFFVCGGLSQVVSCVLSWFLSLYQTFLFLSTSDFEAADRLCKLCYSWSMQHILTDIFFSLFSVEAEATERRVCRGGLHFVQWKKSFGIHCHWHSSWHAVDHKSGKNLCLLFQEYSRVRMKNVVVTHMMKRPDQHLS